MQTGFTLAQLSDRSPDLIAANGDALPASSCKSATAPSEYRIRFDTQ